MEDAKAGLTVEYRTSTKRSGALSYSLLVNVVEAHGIPPEIFVFHLLRPMLATGFDFDMERRSVFQNVATPSDIEETPDRPGTAPETPFYRDRSVELLFRNLSDLDRAKSTISGDIAELVESWNEIGDHNGFESVETMAYGSPPEGGLNG